MLNKCRSIFTHCHRPWTSHQPFCKKPAGSACPRSYKVISVPTHIFFAYALIRIILVWLYHTGKQWISIIVQAFHLIPPRVYKDLNSIKILYHKISFQQQKKENNIYDNNKIYFFMHSSIIVMDPRSKSNLGYLTK